MGCGEADEIVAALGSELHRSRVLCQKLMLQLVMHNLTPISAEDDTLAKEMLKELVAAIRRGDTRLPDIDPPLVVDEVRPDGNDHPTEARGLPTWLSVMDTVPGSASASPATRPFSPRAVVTFPRIGSRTIRRPRALPPLGTTEQSSFKGMAEVLQAHAIY